MVFRKATTGDISQLASIRLEYLKVDFQVSEEQEAKLKKDLPGYYTRHLGRDFYAYIACENDEIVASVFLVVFEMPANTNFITGKIGNVLNVYTKPTYRRQGLASKLLNIMMEEAKNLDLSHLELKATKEGFPLYKKLGFQEQNFGQILPMKYKLS